MVTMVITVALSQAQGRTGLGVAATALPEAHGPGGLPTDKHAAQFGVEVWWCGGIVTFVQPVHSKCSRAMATGQSAETFRRAGEGKGEGRGRESNTAQPS